MRGLTGPAAWVTVVSIAIGCALPENPAPETISVGSPRYTSAAADVGGLAEYSGVPQAGKFVICTSQASPALVPFLYRIEVVSALPSDRFVSEINIYRGTCAVVFETKRRGGPVPQINVTAVTPGPPISASVLFDHRSLEAGFSPAAGYPSAEFFEYTVGSWTGTTMSGFEGAVLKVYYIPAMPCPEVVCDSGGHGGGGTILYTMQFSAT